MQQITIFIQWALLAYACYVIFGDRKLMKRTTKAYLDTRREYQLVSGENRRLEVEVTNLAEEFDHVQEHLNRMHESQLRISASQRALEKKIIPQRVEISIPDEFKRTLSKLGKQIKEFN